MNTRLFSGISAALLLATLPINAGGWNGGSRGGHYGHGYYGGRRYYHAGYYRYGGGYRYFGGGYYPWWLFPTPLPVPYYGSYGYGPGYDYRYGYGSGYDYRYGY